MNAPRLVTALAAVLCTASGLAAQTVQGRFVDPQGRPVAGGRAVLRDARGGEVAAALTGRDGAFVLRAPQAGRYALVVERVGYAATEAAALRLGAGQTVERQVAASAQRVALQGVRAGAQCAPRPGAAPGTALLWEEARKALRGAHDGESAGNRYGVRRFWRQLDPEGRIVVSDSVAPAEVTRGNPFVSASPERLAQTGFIESAGADLVFHAPDAAVLLSTAFQESHCFTVRDGEGGLVGLAFEPLGQAEKSDVTGTLWIDRASAELRRLDYRYTQVPGLGGPSDAASGRIDFRQLEDGRWVVSRWSIRMPVVVAQSNGPAVQIPGAARNQNLQYRLAAQLEQGGTVLDVTTDAGRVDVSRLGVVRGMVFDSTSLQPLAGAQVTVGGGIHAQADAQGYYEVREVPAGDYTLALSSPRLDSLGFAPGPVQVTLREGGAADQDLVVPPLASMWAAACADSGRAPGRGVLVGRVHTASGQPQPGARVTVSWAAAAGAAPATATLIADVKGVYRLCSAPAGPPLTLRVEAARGVTLTVADLRVPHGTALRQDVGLPAASSPANLAGAPGAGQATLSGVVRGASGQPLAGATVRFGQQPAMTTDGQGRFRMRMPPRREYAVTVTHAELGTRTTQVTLGSDAGEVELRPGTGGSAALVATVQKVVQLAAVQAQARNMTLDIQGFYDRQRRGHGIFINEDRLQRNPSGRLTDVLRGVPGVRLIRYVPRDSSAAGPLTQFGGRGGMDLEEQYRIASTRGSTSVMSSGPCWMDVYVDGVQVQSSNPNLSQSLDSFPLSQVQAVEVYRGPAETPEAYKQAWSACGVILLWTKS